MDKEVKDTIELDQKDSQEDVKENINDKSTDKGADLEKNVNESTKDDNSSESECINQEKTEESEPAFKIKMLENKLRDQEDAILRLNAEYANFRRRTAEEKSTIGIYANEKIFNELIPVIDNMERALEACDDKESSLFIGVDMVYKQLLGSLNKSGLERVEAEIGQDFDPNLHMAVMQEVSEEHEAGKILMVLQNGYKLDKKVLRAAMVKVSC